MEQRHCLQTKVQESIRAARQARIAAQAAASNIDLNELDRTTIAILEACTKDNITVRTDLLRWN